MKSYMAFKIKTGDEYTEDFYYSPSETSLKYRNGVNIENEDNELEILIGVSPPDLVICWPTGLVIKPELTSKFEKCPKTEFLKVVQKKEYKFPWYDDKKIAKLSDDFPYGIDPYLNEKILYEKLSVPLKEKREWLNIIPPRLDDVVNEFEETEKLTPMSFSDFRCFFDWFDVETEEKLELHLPKDLCDKYPLVHDLNYACYICSFDLFLNIKPYLDLNYFLVTSIKFP